MDLWCLCFPAGLEPCCSSCALCEVLPGPGTAFGRLDQLLAVTAHGFVLITQLMCAGPCPPNPLASTALPSLERNVRTLVFLAAAVVLGVLDCPMQFCLVLINKAKKKKPELHYAAPSHLS